MGAGQRWARYYVGVLCAKLFDQDLGDLLDAMRRWRGGHTCTIGGRSGGSSIVVTGPSTAPTSTFRLEAPPRGAPTSAAHADFTSSSVHVDTCTIPQHPYASMAAQAKGILKKSPAQVQVQVPPNVNIQAPKSDLEARNLQIAIEHASQIQEQKKLSLQILDDIETLSLLPSAVPPSEDESAQFKTGVVLFQPSDYAALLEERNVNGLCGYALCSNPPRQVAQGREWIRPEGERRFCSAECAKNAMYIKAQLNETPAWERRGITGSEIKLRGEASVATLPFRSRDGQAGDAKQELAMERGGRSEGGSTLVADTIVENQPSPHAPRPGVKFDDMAHESIEGYKVSSTKYSQQGQINAAEK